MCTLIHCMTSELIEYCLNWVGIAQAITYTMIGSTCLTRSGGLSSLYTMGISWISNIFHFPSQGWEGFQRRYSLFSGKVRVKTFPGPLTCNLEVTPKNEIMAWSRSWYNNGKVHFWITRKEWSTVPWPKDRQSSKWYICVALYSPLPLVLSLSHGWGGPKCSCRLSSPNVNQIACRLTPQH